jgi:hypothetical protein
MLFRFFDAADPAAVEVDIGFSVQGMVQGRGFRV